MPNLNLNTPKKRGRGKSFLNVILILLVICLGSYIAYDKMQAKEVKPVKEKVKVVKTENLDVTSKEVTTLYNSIDVFKKFIDQDDKFKDEYLGYLYKKESLDVEEIPNKIILMIALANIDVSKYMKDENGTTKITIPESDIDNTIKRIFGSISYKHESDIPSIQKGTYEYNDKNYTLEYTSVSDSTTTVSRELTTKIVKASKDENNLIIDVKMIYKNATNVNNKLILTYYSDLDMKNKLTESEQNDLNFENLFNDYSDKLSSYQFTFEKIGNDYSFKNIRKVTE